MNQTNKENLEPVAKRYAEQIKTPIRNIVTGDLVQNCLVQVQKLKLDLLIEKLTVNKIIRANGLTFSIVAALPSMGVLALGVWFIYKLLKRFERGDYEFGQEGRL